MGISPVQDDVDRVAHLEARYGDRFKLIADANQGWSRDQAQEFLSADATSRLAFVEQPLRKNDLEGLSILASSSKRPLSVDESVTGLGQAARFVRLGPGNVFNIKSSKFGGPLRAQRIATVAEAFGLRCFMDSMMEFGITQAASLQHAVTVRNLLSIGHAFNSPLRLAEDPTDFSTLVSKGVVCLPPGPGLGIHVDELHVRRMAVASFRLVSSW
jgi:muconate cycloisomerase